MNCLLIHDFSPVNARLLITCGTAFYAIIPIEVNIKKKKKKEKKKKDKKMNKKKQKETKKTKQKKNVSSNDVERTVDIYIGGFLK